MECRIGQAIVHYVEHGTGVPLVALHGAGVDHRDVESAWEAVGPGDGYRRSYPDLPAMGRSTADGINGNDDVVTVLGEFVDRAAGAPALVVGHSYGAYLARGVVARRPELEAKKYDVRYIADLAVGALLEGLLPDATDVALQVRDSERSAIVLCTTGSGDDRDVPHVGFTFRCRGSRPTPADDFHRIDISLEPTQRQG